MLKTGFYREVLLRGDRLWRSTVIQFANSVDSDKVAHYEPPHLDLYCLPSCLYILSIIYLGQVEMLEPTVYKHYLLGVIPE